MKPIKLLLKLKIPLSKWQKCFKIILFECKSAPIPLESILKSNKKYVHDEKLFFVLFSKTLIGAHCLTVLKYFINIFRLLKDFLNNFT